MTTIFCRKATTADLPAIMAIINEAKSFLKAEGSPQWQSGDPNEKIILQDIAKDYSYVLILDGEIAATACLMMEDEPSYAKIDGAWKNTNDPVATIHRIAISQKYRGQRLNDFFFSNLFTIAYAKGFKHIRIDTHAVNKRMQSVALRQGFKYRGLVQVPDPIDSNRYAYELELTE